MTRRVDSGCEFRNRRKKEPEKYKNFPEAERVFPDWVRVGPDGYKTLTVAGFEALTAEALRELRAEKDAQIADLTNRLDRLEAMITTAAAGDSGHN